MLGALACGLAAHSAQAATAPTITSQPQSQTVAVGGTASFSVTATGSPAPTYRWRKNGTNINGAAGAGATYTKTNVQTSDAATYSVVVTNSAGSVTSAGAVLTVTVPPAITTQPQSQTVSAGASVTFTVVATGTPAPTYQWRKGGTNISGATNASYNIASAQLADAGTFSVSVTNSAGNVVSNNATLTVNAAPSITTHPQSQAVNTGASVTFTVAATGFPTPTYQWRKNGTNISGATNASYNIASAQASDVASYSAVATNSQGSATSNSAALTLNAAPAITTQPQSQTAAPGSNVTFTVVATGSPAPTYQWRKDAVNISGATNASLALTNVQAVDGAGYSVVVSNVAGNTTSNTATLTIGPPTVTPPYNVDFESAESFVLGNLHQQNGWQVIAGAAQVTGATSFSGTRSVVLTAGATAAQAERLFTTFSGQAVTFVDVYVRPVADTSAAAASQIDLEPALAGFLKVGTEGQMQAFNGNGSGGGAWATNSFRATLDANNRAVSWIRFTARLDYTNKKWDLYLNGSIVAYDLGFIDNAKTFLASAAFIGHTAADGYFDYFYIGSANPLFTDADGDGMDDAWEVSKGLNPAVNDRNSDLDGDGVKNIDEYLRGTNPSLADTDGDGLSDGVEIYLGSNPTVVDNYQTALPVSSPRLHLRADKGLTINATGGVTTWQDQSGLNNHATAPGQPPTLVASVLNGRPVVRFVQSQSQTLSLPNLMSGAAAGEIFVVVKAVSDADGTPHPAWNFGTSGQSTMYPHHSGEVYDEFGTNTHYLIGNPPPLLTSFNLYNASSQSGYWASRINGVLLFASSTNTVSWSSSPVLGPLNGDIAEVLIYNRVLSSTERQAVGRYLASKYQLPNISTPVAPTALTATAVSSTQVNLTWTDPAPVSAATYVVERQINGGAFVVVGETTGGLGYFDTGLSAGNAYGYRVRAQTYAADSAFSNVATANVVAGLSDVPLSGQRLWLRADGNVPNGIGSNFAWQDQSGLGNHGFATVVAAQQPTVVANVVNGRPVMRFSQSQNQKFNFGNLMSGATAGEIFVILKAVSDGDGSQHTAWNFGTSGLNTIYPHNDGKIYDDFGANAYNLVGDPPPPLNTFNLYNTSSQSGSWIARMNGAQLFSNSSNTVAWPSAPVVGPLNGDIAEIMIYDRVLSSTERSAVNGYLAVKYGLSAPQPAPSGLVATVVSPTRISLAWTDAVISPGVTYTVERSTNGGGSWQTAATLTGQTSYTDTSLTPSTAYSYRVRADNFGTTPVTTATASATTISAGQMSELPQLGMRLWLRPESLVQSAAGLETWSDSSGLGNHATQTTPANRPQVVTGVMNGQPVARFNGTSSCLNLPSFMTGATAGDIFVIVRNSWTSQPADACLFSYFGSSGHTYYPLVSGQIRDGFGSTSNYNVSVGSANLAQTHVYNVSAAANSWTAQLDGSVLHSSTTNTVNFSPAFYSPIIGADRNGNFNALAEWFKGDVAEIIVYDRILTAIERETVNFYLNQRYQFTTATFTSFNQFAYDSDGDGVSNSQEITLGSNPYNADTDGDGIPDGWEVARGTNPLVADAFADPDGDGANNLTEYLRNTNPLVPNASDPSFSVNLVIFQPSRR